MIVEDRYGICVQCLTFNHATFICETLDGFCMQETSFPYVCVVIDDASTDGEQDVIASYLQRHFMGADSSIVKREETDNYILTFVQHTENKNCFFAVYLLKYNHYSIGKSKDPYFSNWADNAKYLALCEGDDYWTDPRKLQLQVDYLEAHDECSMVHTAFSFYCQETGIFSSSSHFSERNKELALKSDNLIYFILNHNDYRIQTCSVLLRADSFRQIEGEYFEMRRGFLMGDTQLWCLMNSVGTIAFLEDCTCVYRKHASSACRPDSIKEKRRFELSCAEMRYSLGSKFSLPQSIQRKFRNECVIELIKYHPYDSCYKSNVDIKLSWLEGLVFRVCVRESVSKMFIKVLTLYQTFLRSLFRNEG